MEFSCRFKSCPHSESLSSNSARIEVKSALPKGGLKKVEQKLVVNWKKNGEAVFHPDCWRRLVTASRKRKKKHTVSRKLSSDVFLIDCEKVSSELLVLITSKKNLHNILKKQTNGSAAHTSTK